MNIIFSVDRQQKCTFLANGYMYIGHKIAIPLGYYKRRCQLFSQYWLKKNPAAPKKQGKCLF